MTKLKPQYMRDCGIKICEPTTSYITCMQTKPTVSEVENITTKLHQQHYIMLQIQYMPGVVIYSHIFCSV